jgi:porin
MNAGGTTAGPPKSAGAGPGLLRAAVRLPAFFGAAGALAMLAGFLWHPARGQQTVSAGKYDGTLLERSTLTGNWNGARDTLAAGGITLSSAVTQFYQGPVSGNARHVFDYGGKAEVFLDIDGAKLGLWSGFAVQVHGEYNYGRTPGAVGGTTIPNNTAMTFPYKNTSGGDLTSVFVSQRLGPNFTVLAGKMNMFDFYASGHKYSGGRGIESFYNTAFVGPPSGIVPVAAFGAIGIYKFDPLTFTGMVYDPTDALNNTGFEDPFSKGVTFRGSVDLSSQINGLPRTDSLMFAVSNASGTDFASLPDLGSFNTPGSKRSLLQAVVNNALFGQTSTLFPAPTQKQGWYWAGYSFEQTLWRSLENPIRSFGLFGQLAISDGNPNSLKWSALGGLGGTSPLPGRLGDKFGVGLFYYDYSHELQKHLEPLVKLRSEYGFEAFYNVAVTRWFRLTADAQVIAPAIKDQIEVPFIQNRTIVSNSTVVVLGLRAQVLF